MRLGAGVCFHVRPYPRPRPSPCQRLVHSNMLLVGSNESLRPTCLRTPHPGRFALIMLPLSCVVFPTYTCHSRNYSIVSLNCLPLIRNKSFSASLETSARSARPRPWLQARWRSSRCPQSVRSRRTTRRQTSKGQCRERCTRRQRWAAPSGRCSSGAGSSWRSHGARADGRTFPRGPSWGRQPLPRSPSPPRAGCRPCRSGGRWCRRTLRRTHERGWREASPNQWSMSVRGVPCQGSPVKTYR